MRATVRRRERRAGEMGREEAEGDAARRGREQEEWEWEMGEERGGEEREAEATGEVGGGRAERGGGRGGRGGGG